MIKRVNLLKGIGRFASLNQTQSTVGDFSDFNVIYASNACGKSTLCDVLRSLNTGIPSYVMGRKKLSSPVQPEVIILFDGGQTTCFQNTQWQQRNNCPHIYVYDDRFVAENIFVGHHINIEQRRRLYGLVIGDQAISLQQAVDNAEQCLTNSTSALNTAQIKLNTIIPAGYSTETFNKVLVVDDVDNMIDKALIELKSAEQTKTKANSIKARRLLSSLPISQVPETLSTLLSSTLDTVAMVAESKIRAHIASKSKGISIGWVKQGFDFVKETNCPYCGQDMQGLDILEAYRVFFSGELQEQEKQREAIKSTVELLFGESAKYQLKQIFTYHETEQGWWKDVVGYQFQLPEIGSIENIVSINDDVYQAMLSALERKQASPGSKIIFTDTEVSAIKVWTDKAEELKSYNEAILTINSELTKLQANAGEIDLVPLQKKLSDLCASKKRYEQETIDAFTSFDTAVKEKAIAQEDKRIANEVLREQSNQIFNQYGLRINELLEFFGVDFKIISDGVNFRGGTPSGQLAVELCGTKISSTPEAAADPSLVSLANTLSGGDRSALALAFFLAKVELATNADQSIVVFDDPYHNQDRSRRQFTIESIHRIAGIVNQCFVFSHDLDFARAVEKRPGKQAKTFLLRPLAEEVTLEARPLPFLPSQAYLKNYDLLYNYLNNPSDHFEHLKEIADTIRIILEEYLRLKFPKEWGENDWLGDMIRKIREAKSGTPLFLCSSLYSELENINNYSKAFHHAGKGYVADEAEVRELRTYVDRTLNIIHLGVIK